MMSRITEYLVRKRAESREIESPLLSDESHWYTEHTALLISTLKWAMLGGAAGLCVGLGTRGFLWSITESNVIVQWITGGRFAPYLLLPLALPACVWLIRTFAPDARGHGTEAVIAAVHTRSGRVDWLIAPIKLAATVMTLAFGGSVGKEGPAAQIGAALTSLFADILRLNDADRRRLVICGISAGFAAVFGTPVSGALFGIEVLYLGQLDYSVVFPALVAGIVGHLACGVRPPFPTIPDAFAGIGQIKAILLAIGSGAVFGIVALLFIETLRSFEHGFKRFSNHPYYLAAGAGAALALMYLATGDAYAGLGTITIDGVLTGSVTAFSMAFFLKIVATAITLEAGGSGGVITPIFFIGATAGAALAPALGVPAPLLAAMGFVAVTAAAANTPIAAAVMAMELLPGSEGVYAALAAVTAFLMVGHRSVYASQKLGFNKSGGLEVELGVNMGDIDGMHVKLRKGSLTERVHNMGRRKPARKKKPEKDPPRPTEERP